ncbi:ABC transporter substrate-binding protein [Candidatus Entotheonella serta]|nr:ABC transporter substrate-binding protein [Candidatus Entotheonella serta]
MIPDLATEWAITDGGKTYTFKLRQGVKFHKGFGDFSAEDVKYSYERVRAPKTASAYAGEFKNVEAIEVVDPHTIRFKLLKPFNFLHKVAINQGHIVKQKAVEQFGDDYPLNPIGTGPFMWDKWVQGSEIHLVANPDYYEGAPNIDRIIFKVIKEETSAEIALINGEIDIFWALQSPDVTNRLRQEKNITVLSRSANHTINFVMNQTYKPLSNIKVRQAIAYAVNRESMIADYFQGTKGMATGVLTKNFPEYSDQVTQYPYDPEKAKELLAEAGYPNGFELDVVSVSLRPYNEIPVMIAEDLRKIGIKPNIKVIERSAYGQARNKGEIQTALTGIVGPPDADHPLWALYQTQNFPPGKNTARYDKIDNLLEAAQVEQDAERQKLYEQIQQRATDDMPVLPLYEDRLFLAHRNAVKGFQLNSLFTVFLYPVSLD